MENNQLNVWTIFFNPKDQPNMYVGRRFYGVDPTEDFIVNENYQLCLGWVHGNAAKNGQGDLVKIARDPEDHKSVVESWI